MSCHRLNVLLTARTTAFLAWGVWISALWISLTYFTPAVAYPGQECNSYVHYIDRKVTFKEAYDYCRNLGPGAQLFQYADPSHKICSKNLHFAVVDFWVLASHPNQSFDYTDTMASKLIKDDTCLTVTYDTSLVIQESGCKAKKHFLCFLRKTEPTCKGDVMIYDNTNYSNFISQCSRKQMYFHAVDGHVACLRLHEAGLKNHSVWTTVCRPGDMTTQNPVDALNGRNSGGTCCSVNAAYPRNVHVSACQSLKTSVCIRGVKEEYSLMPRVDFKYCTVHEAMKYCFIRGDYECKYARQFCTDNSMDLPREDTLSNTYFEEIWKNVSEELKDVQQENVIYICARGNDGNLLLLLIQDGRDSNFKLPDNGNITHGLICTGENFPTTIQQSTGGQKTSQKIQSSTSTPLTTKIPLPCLKTVKRNVTWNETNPGEKVSVHCSSVFNGAKGIAFWQCGFEGEWLGDPDFSNCTSAVVQDSINEIIKSDDITDVASKLEDLTASNTIQFGGDLDNVIDVLNNVTALFHDKTKDVSENEKKELAQKVVDKVVASSSNMLRSKEIWKDLPQEKRSTAGTDFIKAVENMGFLVADFLPVNDQPVNNIVNKENVALNVVKCKHGTFNNKQLSLPLERIPNMKSTSLTLPSGFEESISSGHTTVVFAQYSQLDDILAGADTEIKVKVNTPVLSATVGSTDKVLDLKGKKVDMKFEILDFQTSSPWCVFWDVKAKNWSDSGCKVIGNSSTEVFCQCNHLTNFAVLMSAHTFTEEEKIILTYITMVGCIISIICLTVCVIVFSAFRSLWNLRNTIHRNLCISLLIAELLVVTAMDKTGNKIFCSIVAGVLHFSFLSAFSWMALEGFQIILLLWKVFSQRRDYTYRYYAVGYGVPLLIVIITVSINTKGYGTKDYCWLSAEDGTLWTFAGPIIFVVLLNAGALGLVLRTMASKRATINDTKGEIIKKWIRGTLVLLPLLGLTWLLGFMMISTNAASIAGAYIFTVFNSLQGVGIFVFHCALSKKTRNSVFRALGRKSSFFNNFVSGTVSSSGTSNLPSSNTRSRGSSGHSGPKSKFYCSTPSNSQKVTTPTLVEDLPSELDEAENHPLSSVNSNFPNNEAGRRESLVQKLNHTETSNNTSRDEINQNSTSPTIDGGEMELTIVEHESPQEDIQRTSNKKSKKRFSLLQETYKDVTNRLYPHRKYKFDVNLASKRAKHTSKIEDIVASDSSESIPEAGITLYKEGASNC